MNKRANWRFTSICFGFCLVLALLSAMPALASSYVVDLRVVKVGNTYIKVKWKYYWSHSINVYITPSGGTKTFAGTTNGKSWTVSGLRPDTKYKIAVGDHNGYSRISARTTAGSDGADSDGAGSDGADSERASEAGIIQKTRPLPVTCPHLPPRITITGFTKYTQCRVVDQSAIGRMDLLKRGFIDAVDIWGYPSDSTEVCFGNAGSLVFLDAAYMPRKIMPLLSYERNGMTCGLIDRAGTVVLLREPTTFDQPVVPADPLPAAPVETSSIPLDNCFIKLVETLFLRAEPAGEIIGLVWLNSEVPVIDINGDWFEIEFEGKRGYISRLYHKVLRGGCD